MISSEKAELLLQIVDQRQSLHWQLWRSATFSGAVFARAGYFRLLSSVGTHWPCQLKNLALWFGTWEIGALFVHNFLPRDVRLTMTSGKQPDTQLTLALAYNDGNATIRILQRSRGGAGGGSVATKRQREIKEIRDAIANLTKKLELLMTPSDDEPAKRTDDAAQARKTQSVIKTSKQPVKQEV